MSEEIQKPQCVGFIMDGNRRWAETHGVTASEGHMRGYEAFQSTIEGVMRAQVPHMVCYAFSTENWKRTEEEVGYLMKLLHHALTELWTTITKDGKRIKLKVIGQREHLPESLCTEISRIEALEMQDPELTLWLAISYGGRAEIVYAVNRAVEKGEPVTESSFPQLLWTDGMPDPDLIIRTSGEYRISNFLLWQSAYCEFFFTETLWPDFGETEFQSILEEYGKRSRRKGA
jgi:undecaprenyl diphosphate synthase